MKVTGDFFDSAEKPSVYPSRASEPVLNLTKERTEERLKSLKMFPFMLVEAFLRFSSRIFVYHGTDISQR